MNARGGERVRQAIKYESTEIEPEKSAAEIMQLVRKYGGIRFEMVWGELGLRGVRFAIETPQGPVPVRLEARVERVAEIILQKKPWGHRMRRNRLEYEKWVEEELAYRIAWRQLKDFVEQALLAVETGLFDLAGVFMGSVEVWDNEAEEVVTMAELVASRMSLQSGNGALRLLPRRSE